MIGVYVRQLSGRILQVLQKLDSLYHLLDGERAQQVVVDAVQAVRVLAGVALGPLLGIADCSHAAQVNSRHQISCILLFNQVRERQVCGVRVRDMPAHHQRESAYARRPQDI